MNYKLTVEGNKLIDKFAPEITEQCRNEYLLGLRDKIELKYHTSWDWLLLPCKKFNDLRANGDVIAESYEWEVHHKQIGYSLMDYDIQLTWEKLVEAIQWYTLQLNNKNS